MTNPRKQRNITPGKGDIYTFMDCPSGQFLGFWEGACTAYPLYKMISCREEIDAGHCKWGYAR